MAKTHDTTAGLEDSPSHLLHRALQLALDIYGAEAGPAALTQRQYAVLAAVAADEGASQTGLVRATGIDRSTLADLVARMIAKDWLARERSAEDARANAVKLTDLGREALAAAAPRVANADQRILAVLGHKKREPFMEALRRLARAGEAALTPDPAPDAAKSVKKKKDKKKKKNKHRREAAPTSDAGLTKTDAAPAAEPGGTGLPTPPPSPGSQPGAPSPDPV